MNTMLLKVLAATLWAGAIAASATPADARVWGRTTYAHEYATCGGNVSTEYREACDLSWSYTQNIRFVGSACNGGGCGDESGTLYVEQSYGPGRKVAVFESSCANGIGSIHGLDSCAC